MPYLTDVKGFSLEVVTNDIFPVSIYASLVFYLLAGPVSHALGTKAFVVLGACCKLGTRMILIWGDSLSAMRFMQVLFAAGSASDLILFAHVYAVTEVGAYQSVTGAVSAATLVAYMLAAEFGQVAFDSGASYEALFYFSFVAVGVGTVIGFFLPTPSMPASSLDSAASGSWPGIGSGDRGRGMGTGGASAFRGLCTADWREHRDLALRAVADTREAMRACYGSSCMLVLSGWWIVGVMPAQFIENYGTNLFDAIDPDVDANGHITFAARGLMSIASAAAAVAGPRVAAEPGVYAAASGLAAVSAWLMVGADTLGLAAFAYCITLSALQGASCLVYSQSALAMDAINASRARRLAVNGSADREGGGGFDAIDGAGTEGENAVPSATRTSASDCPPGCGDHALLFGANGALSLLALIVLQGAVDAARVSIRAEIAVAAGWCFAAAVLVLAMAGIRRSWKGSWALEPTAGDLRTGNTNAGRAESDGEGDGEALGDVVSGGGTVSDHRRLLAND